MVKFRGMDDYSQREWLWASGLDTGLAKLNWLLEQHFLQEQKKESMVKFTDKEKAKISNIVNENCFAVQSEISCGVLDGSSVDMDSLEKEFRRNAELQVLQERKEKKMKISDQLKVIDEKTVKAIRDRWQQGEIAHFWNDDDKGSLYILLAKDTSNIFALQDTSEEGIVLKKTDESGTPVRDRIGTNNISYASQWYYESFKELIEDIASNYDHVEKCKRPKLVVNDDRR